MSRAAGRAKFSSVGFGGGRLTPKALLCHWLCHYSLTRRRLSPISASFSPFQP